MLTSPEKRREICYPKTQNFTFSGPYWDLIRGGNGGQGDS